MGTVTVNLDEWHKIQDLLSWLDCLISMGVDDWDGYESAQEEYRFRHKGENLNGEV